MQGADKARVEGAVAAIHSVLPGLVGIYNYGSALLGGLRPSSDIDVLVVVGRATTTEQRRDLVAELLRSSGRPVEVTIVREDRIKPWRMPPEREFQYGEWLRNEYESGWVPVPEVDFDLVALLATALTASVAIVGPPLPDLLDPIPREDLVSAMIDSIPALLGDLVWDPVNVLLTLARMWVTADSGVIVAKDVAAAWALERLPSERRGALAHAKAIYLGEADFEFDERSDDIEETADLLAEAVFALRSSPT